MARAYGRCRRGRRLIARVLAPTLEPGDIVILDNLGGHKGNEARRLIAARTFSSCPLTPPTPTPSSSPSPSSKRS